MAITSPIFNRKSLSGQVRRERPFGKPQPSASAANTPGSGPGKDAEVGGNTVPGGGSSGVSALPFDASGLFPEFQPVEFPSIQPADFKYTDPIDYARKFGDFNRDQIRKNLGMAGEFATEELKNELRGIQGFVPAASALAREQVALDNPFNQSQRESQVEGALPYARGDLAAQRGRAKTYAGGSLPFADRARELGVRSRAADTSTAGGFGSRSTQAAKTSDLMSAEERFQIAQYGESLLGSNLEREASLFLAPTEYANTGSQVRIMPEVGAARLTAQGLESINGQTLISPTTGLQASIQQEQFKTNLEQRTNEFNATGQFQASTFNSSGAFTAGLGLFNYQTGYLSQIQAGNQGNLNAATGLNVQGINSSNYNAGLGDAQSGQAITSTLDAIGALPQTFGAINSILGDSSGTGGNTRSGGSVVADESSGSDYSQPLPDSTAQIPQTLQSLDSSAPYTYRVSPGSSTPAGYSQLGPNNDGSVSVAHNAGYVSEFGQVAKDYSIPTESLDVPSAAAADQSLSSAAALSYLPSPGLHQIALTGNGQPVYSLPAASNNQNAEAGRNSIASTMLALGTMGINDPAAYEHLNDVASLADGSYISDLDALMESGGSKDMSKDIVSKVLGENPDVSNPAVQQVIFGANRIGELWNGMSPYQKSMALTSLAGAGYEAKNGEKLGDKKIPGSEKSVAGPLKVADVTKLTAQGLNGYGLARNWGQISAITDIAGNSRDPGSIARIADHIGMLGYGPQGASVAVDPKKLRTNSRPAPEFGVGAAHFNSSADVPKNYKPVANSDTGGVIALPENLAHTSPLAYGNPALVGQKLGLVNERKHPAQRLWKRNSAGQVIRGSAGGSAIVSSMALMQRSNPALASSIYAHSLFSNIIGNDAVGESEEA